MKHTLKRAWFIGIACIWMLSACSSETASNDAAESKMKTDTTNVVSQTTEPSQAAGTAQSTPKKDITLIHMQTNHGLIKLELDAEKAPLSVANFVQYVNDGFYDGTIFHRVISSFMIQGGGFTQEYAQKETRKNVDNEGKNGLKNKAGTIAMARTSAPHSASSQFFINTKDNDFLDYPGQDGWGYAVFGKVVEGLDIVEKIKAVKTGSGGPFPTDAPQEMVIIEKMTVVEG